MENDLLGTALYKHAGYEILVRKVFGGFIKFLELFEFVILVPLLLKQLLSGH